MDMMILLGVMLLLFVGMNYFGKKKQNEANARRLEAIKVGNHVRTHSGFYGTIVDVDGDAVTLESPGGAETVWHKNAISGVEEPPFAVVDEDAADAADEEDAQDADQTVSTLENPIEKESDK